MFLILSAAYVGQELQSEFGKIPPSFLPLGNKRLFEHQVKLAPKTASVYMSVPETYQVSKIDLKLLKKLNITIIRTPDDISLGASLVAALNLSDQDLNSPLHVLYGDTLLTDIPEGDDIVCVSSVSDSYKWAIVTGDNLNWLQDSDIQIESDVKNVVNGYFKFSKPRQLMRSVTQANWNFLKGLNRYHQYLGLTSVSSDNWLDFGHVNTYYRSKANFTTQRAFNELSINSKWVEKSSLNRSKIIAEANWFENLPFSLKGYTPQYLGSFSKDKTTSYRLEYLHLTALNELYVFGELPGSTWDQILHCCVDFLKACLFESSPSISGSNTLDELFGNKTNQRLGEYCSQMSISLDDEWYFNKEKPVSLQYILEESNKYLPEPKSHWGLSIMHGDFCFSNILYDFRAAKIKTIDPRGIMPNGEHTMYGDIRYDIAKLSHSIIGMYDCLIAGYYDVEIKGKQIEFHIEEKKEHKLIQKRFIIMIEKEFGISAVSLLSMQIQLFLSMLPLHNDNPKRQKALFANAFRLYNLMKSAKK